MKRLVNILLCFLMIFGMTGCAKADTKQVSPSETMATTEQNSSETESVTTAPAQETESPMEMPIDEEASHVLVAYFSRTGHTRPLAEYAASYYGADIYEILAKEPYSDEDINYNDSNSRANREQDDKTVRPEINGSVDDMEKYDTVVLAYPIWWGQAPRIISTFLETYDFSGKTIIPFCTSGSSGIGSSADNLHGLVSDSAHWIDGKRFAAGTSSDELIAWLMEVYPADTQRQDIENTGNNEMKLLINSEVIHVTWENCTAVNELTAEAENGDIVVHMSMYGGWEQVGSLGHSYTRGDRQMTAVNGDIVLYSGNQIVVFYGSNSWSYTKLGKIDLSAEEVTELLSKGDITLTITK